MFLSTIPGLSPNEFSPKADGSPYRMSSRVVRYFAVTRSVAASPTIYRSSTEKYWWVEEEEEGKLNILKRKPEGEGGNERDSERRARVGVEAQAGARRKSAKVRGFGV